MAAAATGSLADRRLYACMHLALHVGLRKGELCGLRWQDLDLASRRLTIARSYKEGRRWEMPPSMDSGPTECPLPSGERGRISLGRLKRSRAFSRGPCCQG